mgnify:CR=1 FL=1
MPRLKDEPLSTPVVTPSARPMSEMCAPCCPIRQQSELAKEVVDVQLQVNAALGAAVCTADLNRDGICNVIDVQRGVNAGLGGACVIGP